MAGVTCQRADEGPDGQNSRSRSQVQVLELGLIIAKNTVDFLLHSTLGMTILVMWPGGPARRSRMRGSWNALALMAASLAAFLVTGGLVVLSTL